MASNLSKPYPTLKTFLHIESNSESDELWDIQFCPYDYSACNAPVFATTGCNSTAVCRVSLSDSDRIEVLRLWEEESDNESPNSITWLQHPESSAPLLCVSGCSRKIKVYDVLEGTLLRTLTGHGGRINDLKTHPLFRHVFASASEDHTVRLWDVTSPGRPCYALSGASGHAAGLITTAFHQSGKYLLSAGFDSRINLWKIPETTNQPRLEELTTLVAPHFTTTKLHTNYVDCIMFYGDFILSKSAQSNTITMWKINGFSSSQPVPPDNAAVICEGSVETLSSFGEGFQTLMTFGPVHCEPYYIRFGLFHKTFSRPILALGNHQSTVNFWDLHKAEETTPGDPFKRIPPHHSDREILKHSKGNFCCRGIAFSPNGDCCVVVGSQGAIYCMS